MRKMISLVNFRKIASICVGYFFSLRFLAKFEFPTGIPNKTYLNLQHLI